jgi:hypothetical protein
MKSEKPLKYEQSEFDFYEPENKTNYKEKIFGAIETGTMMDFNGFPISLLNDCPMRASENVTEKGGIRVIWWIQ